VGDTTAGRCRMRFVACRRVEHGEKRASSVRFAWWSRAPSAQCCSTRHSPCESGLSRCRRSIRGTGRRSRPPKTPPAVIARSTQRSSRCLAIGSTRSGPARAGAESNMSDTCRNSQDKQIKDESRNGSSSSAKRNQRPNDLREDTRSRECRRFLARFRGRRDSSVGARISPALFR